MDYVIGVDIGTQSTKALLADARGVIVAQYAQTYQPDTPAPLWAEQWPQVWLDAVTRCIAGCVSRAGASAASVKAVCISSLYGGSGIPVDDTLQPLHPCLIWMDRRAESEVAWICANLDQERLYDITMNGVDSYYGFTKMLWLRDNRPEVWGRTRYLLPPNAYVAAVLTGEVAVDHSSAGNIGGVYDMARRQWSTEMLDVLGIPVRMMPERLVGSCETVGRLRADWAGRLGLLDGTPVIAGGVDAAVATFAAGATRPGQHVAMLGTSMCWGTVAPAADARHGLVAMPYVFGGEHDLYVFGGAITAGASVTWFQDLVQQKGAAALRELDRAAEALAPGSEGALFLPYLMGERSPIWDGRASGAFVGLNLTHTTTHLFRAVLEGVTFALRHNIEAGSKVAGTLDDRLIVVGGAAKSDLWMQIVADVTGYPVVTIAEEVEAALGAALLAALGVGLASQDEARKGWVTLRPRAEPGGAARASYDRAFSVYAGLYPALKQSMHLLRNSSV